MIQCNSMDAACIDFSRPELPPTLKGSPAHLATVEIRLALGWTVCEGHCLWNALIRCGHLLKMTESQKPQATSAFCLCNSLVSRVSTRVCVFQHFTMKIPFNQGFSEVIWQSLATCSLPVSSGSACAAQLRLSAAATLTWAEDPGSEIPPGYIC